MKKCLVVLGLVMLCLSFNFNAFAEVDEGHAWTHSDWSSRVLWEARYALSQNADGESSTSAGSGVYKKWYGDWNYTADDTYARNEAGYENWDIVGSLGYSNGYYLGGQCTYFVRLILYRATYWNYDDHYTTPAYPSSVYTITGATTDDPSEFQAGWVLLTPTNTHYAIAEKRETIGGVTGWWVIDSNWVDYSTQQFVIGKHFMSDSFLESQGYYGWQPDRGSNN